MEGVYIYPDWASCVRGAWAKHTLVQGVQCSLEQVARVGAELGVVETRQLAPALLTYSPPSHYSTGIQGHITDPFEDNTVRGAAGV